MDTKTQIEIEEAKQAAIKVLEHNAHGPFDGLPRTAGWGYPEPYTRDLMLSIFGIVISGNAELIESIKRVLEVLAQNQSYHGHITSLVHDKEEKGSSDATPLFLIGTSIFRTISGNTHFLEEAVGKAHSWMEHQSPSDRELIAQQPTSDWRDEQWVIGYGLYVNVLTYIYLRMLGNQEKAKKLLCSMERFKISHDLFPSHDNNKEKKKPYLAFWSYKIYSSDRFDLLGNSLAILAGIMSSEQSDETINWIESECDQMKKTGDLCINLPPNFFPYINPIDPDWMPRYALFNNPGDYHNGGIWTFICGFYIAALVATKKYDLAENKIIELTNLIKIKANNNLRFGFNEWIKAQNGVAMGQDWQTWSASLYLYAAQCVETRTTPFFDEIRKYT